MKDKTAAYWDAYYQASFVFDRRREMVWKEVCRYLQRKYIPEDATILDLGAGYCNFINQIRGREKHAVDVIMGIKEYASPDVKTHVHSCTDLSNFDDGYFDTIFASNFLEHLSREESLSAIPEMNRVLKLRGPADPPPTQFTLLS